MHYLDKLTRVCTAFRTWDDFAEHLDRGYVPTIYSNTRRKRLLRRVLLCSGYRVWPTVAKRSRVRVCRERTSQMDFFDPSRRQITDSTLELLEALGDPPPRCRLCGGLLRAGDFLDPFYPQQRAGNVHLRCAKRDPNTDRAAA